MKHAKTGFTLVELIVVITILAILGTIAFISLNGYNNDAKNGKVVSDLRNLAWAVEVSKTTDNTTLLSLITNTGSTNTVAGSSIVNNSWSTLASSWSVYLVGNINFGALKQNGDSFKDPNSFDENQEYIFAIAYSPDYSFFEFAGQVLEGEGIKKARLTGTYAKKDLLNDVASLVSTQANDTPVENGEEIIGDFYQP